MKPWEREYTQEPVAKKPWEREYTPSPEVVAAPEQISGIESAGRGVFYGALQQPRDVVGAGLMKGAGYLGLADTKDIPFKDLLASANELSLEGRSAQAQQEDPLAFGGGQLVGNIATSLIPATGVSRGLVAAAPVLAKAPLVGQALSSGARAIGTGGAAAGKEATLLAKMGALGGQGAIQGGAFSGVTKGDLSDAALGAVGGAAFPLAGAGIKKVVQKTIFPNSNVVRNTASKLYKKADELGAKFSPETRKDVLEKSRELIINDPATLEQMGSDDITKEILKFAEGKEDLTLATFQNLDKIYGNKAHMAFSSGDFNSARKFGDLQHNIREAVVNEKNIIGSAEGVTAQKEATRLWSIQSKMDDIERIVENSQYAAVPATAIRTGFKRLATNDKLLRGYTKQEIEAIKKAAKTGKIDSITHTFGSRLMSLVGAGVGGIQGAAIGHGISSAGRASSEALRKADASKVTRLLAKRSGLEKKVNRFTNKEIKEIVKLPPKEALEILRVK